MLPWYCAFYFILCPPHLIPKIFALLRPGNLTSLLAPASHLKEPFHGQRVVAENIEITTKMPSPPAHHVDKPNQSLFSLPPEVITKIFGNFSSFFDVFALAATCRRLRHVWSTSVIPIYNSVAPRSIALERDARRFLVDQRGPKLDFPMVAETVVQMVRNASIVEKAVLQFEREIVCRVRSKFTLEVLVNRPDPHIQTHSRWIIAWGVLWCGGSEASSDLDRHRAHSFRPNLLYALGPDETRSCWMGPPARINDFPTTLPSPRDDKINSKHRTRRRYSSAPVPERAPGLVPRYQHRAIGQAYSSWRQSSRADPTYLSAILPARCDWCFCVC